MVRRLSFHFGAIGLFSEAMLALVSGRVICFAGKGGMFESVHETSGHVCRVDVFFFGHVFVDCFHQKF